MDGTKDDHELWMGKIAAAVRSLRSAKPLPHVQAPARTVASQDADREASRREHE
jgi:hypothetical protein